MMLVDKKCAICQTEILPGSLQCTKCGSGVFESVKTRPNIHAQTSKVLSLDEINTNYLPSKKTKNKRAWFSRLFGGKHKESNSEQFEGSDFSKATLDGETLKRYIRSTYLINDLTYLNLDPNINLGNGEFPENENSWDKTGAVIVPSDEITNFNDFHGTDYRWWVLTSDDSKIIEKELLYIVLDFDLPRADRALSFFLVHEHDANWARFLVKSNSLVILSGPSKSISNALIVPIENSFRSHVNLWLSKFG